MIYGLIVPVSQTETKHVPLTRRDISIVIRPTGASITEKLLFFNTQKNDVETEFRYPMKKGRVNGLRFKVEDGEWMSMNVEEKLSASKQYHNAVSTGKQAVLGSQLSDDVFSIKIGRLRTHEMIWIEVNMYCELDWANCYAYRHQLTMVPPYIMEDDVKANYQSKAPKFNNGTELPYGIFMNIKCEDISPFTIDVIGDNIMSDIKSNESNVVELTRVKLTGNKDIHIQMHPSEMKPSVHVTETDEYYYYQMGLGHSNTDLGPATLIKSISEDEQLKRVLADYELVESDIDTSNVDTPKINTYVKSSDKYYVFVIDGSGSMAGDAITNARTALKIAIKQLPQTSKYMILVFGSNSSYSLKNQFYPPQLQNIEPLRIVPCHPNVQCDSCNQYPLEGVRYHKTNCDIDFCQTCYKSMNSPENFEEIQPITKLSDSLINYDDKWAVHSDESFTKCIEWIETNVKADYGGTEMAIAIDSVYERLNGDKRNVIIMLTDAEIGNGQVNTIVAKVKNSSIPTEIFGLGIGNGCSMSLLENMSNACNGVSFHVVNNSDIKDKTQRMMSCATESQFLRNLSFDVPKHVNINTCKPITCYFRGEPLNAFVQVKKSDFKGDETFILKSGDTPIMMLKFSDAQKSVINLETIYHMTYLEQLLKFPNLYYGYNTNNDGKMTKDEYRKTIIQLACKYNIVTSYTSAIIVRELVNSSGTTKLEKVDIPIAIGKDNSSMMFSDACYTYVQQESMSVPSRTLKNSNYRCSSSPLATSSAVFLAHSSASAAFGAPASASASAMFNSSYNVDNDLSEEESMDNSLFEDEIINNVEDKGLYFGSSKSYNTKTTKKSKSIDVVKPIINKYNNMSTDALIEQLVLEQLGSGTWKYNESLMNYICNKSIDEYKTILKLTDDDLLMTLIILAYMQEHPEHFSTFAKSFKNGEIALTQHVSDFKKTILEIVQLGFN